MYRDLHTRIILNNVIKVTLDIVEFFFRTSSCARINYAHQKHSMCYWKTELGETYQGLLEFYSS